MTPAELLLAAADKLEPTGAWTKHDLARNAKGRAVPPHSPSAVCWCMFGALQSFFANPHKERAYCVARDVLLALNYNTTWNDASGRTQDRVIAALRDTAKRLKNQ